jgi:hypothetical protein
MRATRPAAQIQMQIQIESPRLSFRFAEGFEFLAVAK